MDVKGLLVMDVDSTLILEEAIDLLGEKAGVGAAVADITERAMRGELDFEEALIERVALLEGLPLTVFEEVLEEIHFTPGAAELIDELHHRGYKVGVVSGGFHETVDPLAHQLGIDYVKANRLEVKEHKLTGRVIGDIVTKETKKAYLTKWAKENGLQLSQTIAVGDGANDLPMIRTAGIGVAFCAKPIVQEEASYRLNERNLYQLIPLVDDIHGKPVG